MARSKNAPATAVESIRHNETRKNIPTNELRDFLVEYEVAPAVVRYPRDPSLDPQLVWKGKDEQDSRDLAVEVVPVYIQEKIRPQALSRTCCRTATTPGSWTSTATSTPSPTWRSGWSCTSTTSTGRTA